ncbi:hypothetical protein QYE76_047363 [Lolium multiflorum]|uniref:Uncharacterized protein n=1 Tax=Lolium multiflorum TaxID=4521 RepID=A0AAD8TPQ9_LOLMU|nr:hypothetical protein QYE76_047363 [Lolium multiflorum]
MAPKRAFAPGANGDEAGSIRRIAPALRVVVHRGGLYIGDVGRDVEVPASSKTPPIFQDGPATETSAWTANPHYSKSPEMVKMVRRICKLTESGLPGKDLTLSLFTKRIQPLQHRDRLMYLYSVRDETMRATKDNLSSDALDKRLRVMIKVPRDVHSHVCRFDIYTDGAGPALESLEEKDLRTLTRTPHTGPSNPKAASEARNPEAAPPAKRKRAAASGSMTKHTRKAPSAKVTKKLEKEKLLLKEIDTGSSKHGLIENFFSKPGKVTGNKPQKMKLKPSPATMPITPQVEIPPKPSSSAIPDPKDAINLDDLPSATVNSGKRASPFKPVPEEPEATSAEAMANDAPKKLTLSGAHVWGEPDPEQKELAILEDNLHVLFVKHKAVRQNTRKLHEEMHKLMLDQKSEIERLNKKEAEDQQAIQLLESRLKANEDLLAKRPSIDDISAKLQVLETEQESLQASLKESYKNETKMKKELEDNHAKEMSEMTEKLKDSTKRFKTLASKLTAAEAEAIDIDQMIFRKDF